MNGFLLESIKYFAIAFAITLATYLFRRYLPPAQDASSRGHVSIEDLETEFDSINWIVYASMCVIGIVMAWTIHKVLVTASHSVAESGPPAAFHIFPQSAIWWFLPGFAAVSFSWEITLFLWSLRAGREKVLLFREWTNRNAGYDSTKALRILGLIVVVPVAIFTAIEIPSHVNLCDNFVLVQASALSPAQRYFYADVTRLTEIEGFRDRDGKLTRRAGLVLDFKDGRRWSSADIGDFHDRIEPAMKAFLEQKTSLEVGFSDTASDIPPLARGPSTN